MVWGKAAASGVDDLVAKLRSNDPKLQSLHIMRFRKLGHEVRHPQSFAACCSHGKATRSCYVNASQISQCEY
jgi:hypothetical protein